MISMPHGSAKPRLLRGCSHNTWFRGNNEAHIWVRAVASVGHSPVGRLNLGITTHLSDL